MTAVAARELGVELGVSSLEASSVGYGAAVRVRARRSRRPVLLASVEEMHHFLQALYLWSKREQMNTCERADDHITCSNLSSSEREKINTYGTFWKQSMETV